MLHEDISESHFRLSLVYFDFVVYNLRCWYVHKTGFRLVSVPGIPGWDDERILKVEF